MNDTISADQSIFIDTDNITSYNEKMEMYYNICVMLSEWSNTIDDLEL